MSSVDQSLISSSSGAEEFIVSLLTNLIIGLCIIIFISFARRSAYFTYFFDVRRSDYIRNRGYTKGSVYLERPPRQSKSLFGWIHDTLNIPENVILRSAGLDAVICLRFFLRMGMYLTVYAISSFIIIVPVQASSANNNGTNGFKALSILSLETGSDKLWANLIFCYIFTGILLKILHSTWFEIILLKQRWLANEQLLGQRMTVLVNHIPRKYSTSASLYALFEELYPEQIAGAYVVQTNPRLTELYELRENCVNEINTAKGQIELSTHIHQEAINEARSPKVPQGDDDDGTSTTTDTTTTPTRGGSGNNNNIIRQSDIVTAPEISITKTIHDSDRPKMSLSIFGVGEKDIDVIDYYTDKLHEYDNEIKIILGKIADKQYTSPLDIANGTISLVSRSKSYHGHHYVQDTDSDDDDDNDNDNDGNDIHAEDKQIFSHTITSPHVGFVTFRSSVSAASALNTPISQNIKLFKLSLAPQPEDISWFGITATPTYKTIASTLFRIATFFMIIFYAIPITFVSALLSVESLSEIFPFLEPALTFSPFIKGIISGILPSLALIIFMALLPHILYAFGYFSGLESRSEISIYVFKSYFLFQFINFFLIACFSSTIFQELQTIINNPGKIPTLLASGLPQSALLFINYIMMRAFYTNFFAILDIPDIILNRLFYFLSKTPSATANALAPTPEHYMKQLPESVLIFIIAFCFGTIQPMILVFAAMYFFTLYFAKRYTLTWISVNPYQTGGGYWPLVFNRILLGVVVSQLCLFGLLGLKEKLVPAVLMIPLIIFTCWYWYRYSNIYRATEHRLTLISARVTDTAIETLTPEQQSALLDGFDLPAGPKYLSLLPFLIPDVMGDTTQRESILKQIGVKDQSTSCSFDLFQNLVPQNIPAVPSSSQKESKESKEIEENKEDVKLSRDFLCLPEQYHGDDVAMDPIYKQWLYDHDLETNQPRDILLNGFLPPKWVQQFDRVRTIETEQQGKMNMPDVSTPNPSRRNSEVVNGLNTISSSTSKLNSNKISSSPTNSITRGDDAHDIVIDDDDDENLFTDSTKLTLEQRILLQQLVFRWKRSQTLTTHRGSVVNGSIIRNNSSSSSGSSSSTITGSRTTTTAINRNNASQQQDPETIHEIDDIKQDLELQEQPIQPPIDPNANASTVVMQRTASVAELPIEDHFTTPFSQQQLQSSQVSGTRRGTRYRSDTSTLLFSLPNESQSLIVPESGYPQALSNSSSVLGTQPQSQPHNGVCPEKPFCVTGVSHKIPLPPQEELDQVMMRYFSPETNPHYYSRVSERVWGTTYITYLAIKELQKKQKQELKEQKKNKA